MGNRYGSNPVVTIAEPSRALARNTVTSGGAAAGGRPPSFIQIVTSRLDGRMPLTWTYDVSRLQRKERPSVDSFA